MNREREKEAVRGVPAAEGDATVVSMQLEVYAYNMCLFDVRRAQVVRLMKKFSAMFLLSDGRWTALERSIDRFFRDAEERRRESARRRTDHDEAEEDGGAARVDRESLPTVDATHLVAPPAGSDPDADAGDERSDETNEAELQKMVESAVLTDGIVDAEDIFSAAERDAAQGLSLPVSPTRSDDFALRQAAPAELGATVELPGPG